MAAQPPRGTYADNDRFGDAIDFALAYLVYKTCTQVEGGLPGNVKAKMWRNILLDFLVGLIPFVGDVADAMFRANTRNAIVLEMYLKKKYKARNEPGRPRRRTDDVEMMQPSRHDTLDGPPEYSSQPPERRDERGPRKPERATTNKKNKSGRWYGGGSSPQDRDLERGEEPEYEYRPAQPPRPR